MERKTEVRKVERDKERQSQRKKRVAGQVRETGIYLGSCDAVPHHTSVTLTTGCADGIMVAGGCGAETGGVVWTGVGVVEMTGV